MNDEKAYIDHALMLKQLHRKWRPYNAQVGPIRSVFKDRLAVVFLECGRKFGKTEWFLYCLWRTAQERPGTANYYFAPFGNQAREIIWANRRAQDFGPREWLAGKPNDTEMRIKFKNGSFIKFEGSDNYDSRRGIGKGMGLVCYEEFKDFRPQFHQAFGPNIADNKATLLIAGTPPEVDGEFTVMADQCKMDPHCSYFNFPTWVNPHIDKDFLRREKATLYARGDGAIWEREYGAKRIKGGPNAIFPMWSDRMVKPHHEILRDIHRDRHKLTWLAVADPGTITVFGMLYMAVNPYTQTVYCMDELYLERQENTSTAQVIPTHQGKKAELMGEWDDWLQPCDEAAAWFINEAAQSYGENFYPTEKAANKKDQGLSLIKDQMREGRLVVSDRCRKLVWEISNYVKDKNGKIPKENDHLIDCLRYGNGAAGLTLRDEEEPKPPQEDEVRRYYTIEDDLRRADVFAEWGEF